MKTPKARFATLMSIKSLLLVLALFPLFQVELQAQEQTYSKPTWLFGIAAAANANFYRGSTQQITNDLRSPVTFHDGAGVGLFVAPLVEYLIPNTRFGIMFQAGYDERKSTFEQKTSVCNCPIDLKTNLSYLTLEPSIRFSPLDNNFYLFGGPRFAFNLSKSFTYKVGRNPDYPDQEPPADIEGDISNIHDMLISMQIGAGYDIPLSPDTDAVQSYLSPFVSFQPYFGQSPRSIETWNITTLRVGLALKFGHGTPVPMVIGRGESNLFDANISFYVDSPENIPSERQVVETFPIVNYVFFDRGSTAIPSRYTVLRKSQVADFKEDQLEEYASKEISGRAERSMNVYYNVLNILGDRMGKNPTSTVTLVGSSELGREDGLAMATSVQNYLVDVFNINRSRITLQGIDQPEYNSKMVEDTTDLELLQEDNRRVTIESSSPELLMEFQTGKGAAMRPAMISGIHSAPFDSYVAFHVDGAEKSLDSWKLEMRDNKNNLKTYGPYTRDVVYLAGKTVLGTQPEGHYKATMVGKTKQGMTLTREAPVHMVLWTPSKEEHGLRYSVVYEFDESKVDPLYERYLSEIVAPSIPQGSTVITHGHTDDIGDEAYNQTLSVARAKNVESILSNALAKSGRKDVVFRNFGYGEDVTLSPFNNTLPEERFYNRTVIIDIIPRK